MVEFLNFSKLINDYFVIISGIGIIITYLSLMFCFILNYNKIK